LLLSGSDCLEAMPKHKILIVEDEAVVADELKHNLDADGYEVSIAESGERAVHESVRNQPDLVLMDVVLPGSADGISVAEQFVSLDIPVVYMTGYSDGHLFDRARHTEPVAYLQKPLRIAELRRVVELALSNRVRHVERERQRALQEEQLRDATTACTKDGKPPIEIIIGVDIPSSMRLVENGRVDVMSTNKFMVSAMVQRNPNTLAEAFDEHTNALIAVGVPKGDSDLAKAVRDGLAVLRRNGTEKQIYDRYNVDYDLARDSEIRTQ